LLKEKQQQHHQPKKEVDNNNNNNGDDPNFDRKLDLITAGAKPFVKTHLLTKITPENCKTIVNYILAFQTEVSPSQNYRIDTVAKLKTLAQFHHPKSFRDMTRQDVIDFLERLRKPEALDHLHQWVGTYGNYRIILLRFFKWLYCPDIESSKRPKPAVMENIPQIKRKEISIYKPTDMWTEEDDLLFYKYCPSVRDRAWHAVSRDTGCRPDELLKLKIKDLVVVQTETYQIARVTVNGKTGVRTPRINHGYPYLKDWLSHGNHPYSSVPDAPLFCGVGRKNLGRRLATHTINAMYDKYKKVVFPNLLDNDPTVPPEDKQKIKDLLQKRWNPYVRRHTAATEISKTLKAPELVDQYMGWSRKGNTHVKYQHYYADDSFNAILEADGLVPHGTAKKRKDLLKPIPCPNCDEPNKPGSRFCSKCKYVLSYDAYQGALEEERKKAEKLQHLEERQAGFEEKIAKQLDVVTRALKRMIATESDLQMDNPEDARELNAIYKSATKKGGVDYFGEDVRDLEFPPPSLSGHD
jgi:integrase/recombinase XerD